MRAQVLIVAALLLPVEAATVLARPQNEDASAVHWLGEDELSPALLKQAAHELKSENPQIRQRAIAFLSSLTERALPAIAGRTRELATQSVERAVAFKILEGLLQATSAHADPDAPPPLGTGARTLLSKHRDSTTLVIVEAVLLLQSLEAMHVTAAGKQIAEFFDIAEGALGNELRRARKRAGEWLLPALISLRSDERKSIKRWARAGVLGLGAEDIKMATNLDDAHRVAEVVMAYSSPPDYEAMPTLVRFTRDSRIQVREAARVAVDRFGQNAIWQLRELYEELAGKRASRGWDAARTARELYAIIDDERMVRANQALAQGVTSKDKRNLSSMQRSFDIALSIVPDHPQRQAIAQGYAEVGAEALTQGQYSRAEQAYRTALHLAAGGAEANRYRTELLFTRAEQALATGVVDRGAYEKVLRQDSDHAGAQAALDSISGRETARLRRRKQLAAGIAGVLLVVAAGWLALHRMHRTTANAAA